MWWERVSPLPAAPRRSVPARRGWLQSIRCQESTQAFLLQPAVSMPACISGPASTHLLADAVAFDFSDTDDVDIGSASPTIDLQTRRKTARELPADMAEVLAFCALWVFKDRPRRRARGVSARALPGL